MNVNDAISDYLMDIGHLDKRTVEGYRQRLTVFADWCDQEHVELEQVNNRMVQAFLTWLPAHHHPQKHGKLTLSTATLYGYTLYIKVFLSWCLRDEEYSQYTTLARVKGVRMPRKEKRLKHIFTNDEIAALFEAAKHPSKTHEYQLRDLAIVALLLDTGIRASELRSLSIGNVTLGRAPGEDSYVRVLGKGKKEREIPLGRQTRRILSRYIRACRQHAAKNAPVFPSRQGGGQLSHQGLKDLLLRIKAVSTLPDDCLVHPHKFRHTYASKFIEASGDVYSLSRLLGHSSVKTTEEYLQTLEVSTGRIRSRLMDYHSIVDSLCGKVRATTGPSSSVQTVVDPSGGCV